MKRILVGLPVGLFVVSILTGCGSSTMASSTNNGSAASATPKKVIIWDCFEMDAQKKMMRTMIDGSNAGQREYVTEHIYVPFMDHEKQLTLGMTSKQLPGPAILDGYSMTSFISMDLFADISDADVKRDEYITGPMESTMMDGKRYGIPFATNYVVLFYDKDLFDTTGLKYPDENTTWKEFRWMAKTLTKNGMYGFGNVATNTDEGTFQCLQWLYTAGGSYRDIKGGVGAYKLMQGMMKEGSQIKEVANQTRSDVNNNSTVGNLAVQQSDPQQVSGIEANMPGLNHGVIVLPKKDASSPQATSILGGENMGTVEKDDVSGALAFLKYHNKADVIMQVVKQYGFFPPKTGAAEDAYWIKGPIQVAFIKQLDTFVPRGPPPLWPSYSAAIQTGFQEVLASARTSEQATQGTQTTVDAMK